MTLNIEAQHYFDTRGTIYRSERRISPEDLSHHNQMPYDLNAYVPGINLVLKFFCSEFHCGLLKIYARFCKGNISETAQMQ